MPEEWPNEQPDYADDFSIGCDLGGTSLRLGAFGSVYECYKRVNMPTRLEEGPRTVARDLCEAARQLINEFEAQSHRCRSIGVGSPGPLMLPKGVLCDPPNLPGWNNFCLRDAIENELGRSIYLGGDANVAALAEQRLGAGRSYKVDSLCMLTLGTGVGSGLIQNGRMLHGNKGIGSEAGHIIVEPYGAPCGCGGSGCLEQYASATGLRRIATEMQIPPQLTVQEIAMAALNGDRLSRELFERLGEWLGIGLTCIINTLNFPLYAIGGGVSEAWDLFSPMMFTVLEKNCYLYRLAMPGSQRPLIVRAELGADAGLIGAALLGPEN